MCKYPFCKTNISYVVLLYQILQNLLALNCFVGLWQTVFVYGADGDFLSAVTCIYVTFRERYAKTLNSNNVKYCLRVYVYLCVSFVGDKKSLTEKLPTNHLWANRKVPILVLTACQWQISTKLYKSNNVNEMQLNKINFPIICFFI